MFGFTEHASFIALNSLNCTTYPLLVSFCVKMSTFVINVCIAMYSFVTILFITMFDHVLFFCITPYIIFIIFHITTNVLGVIFNVTTYTIIIIFCTMSYTFEIIFRATTYLSCHQGANLLVIVKSLVRYIKLNASFQTFNLSAGGVVLYFILFTTGTPLAGTRFNKVRFLNQFLLGCNTQHMLTGTTVPRAYLL